MQAVKAGLLKILSKMGISLLTRYFQICFQFNVPSRRTTCLIYFRMKMSVLVLCMEVRCYHFDNRNVSIALLLCQCEFNLVVFLMACTVPRSYHGAQIFEIHGLGQEVVDTAFRGSMSRIGGLTLNEVSPAAFSAPFSNWSPLFTRPLYASKLYVHLTCDYDWRSG